LPDGICSNQKFCRAFYGQLSYSTTISYILWPFGNFAIWYIFPSFGIINNEKSGDHEVGVVKKLGSEEKIDHFRQNSEAVGSYTGLPDFSWFNIIK
jgi:hypothetical protein